MVIENWISKDGISVHGRASTKVTLNYCMKILLARIFHTKLRFSSTCYQSIKFAAFVEKLVTLCASFVGVYRE